jgi:CheY-like chemotaxis protein
LARLAELGPVDVALVDWTMPVMDGVAFLKVRAVPEYERIRVIIVTSESDPARSCTRSWPERTSTQRSRSQLRVSPRSWVS